MDTGELDQALGQVARAIAVRREDGKVLPAASWSEEAAIAAACLPENLGDPGFRADHGLRYAYVGGAMANGIASEDFVEALASAGMLGFFGAAGLAPPRVEAALARLEQQLGERQPWGVNLIHSPNEPDLEAHLVDLFLKRRIRTVEASAYLDLTLPVVRYRVAGIHRGPSGQIVVPNKVIAKVSRVEVASKFLAPPPAAMLRTLVERGDLTAGQAELAASVPMAQDLTAEADSAGHTDNRPALALLPTLLSLRNRAQARYGDGFALRVGAAGGIGTPTAVAACFAMGAAYVVTGSINQACVESGSSDKVRTMLATAEQGDVTMAPAADMFEMGVKVQVLKRGTMFAMRAARLYELYRTYASLEALPAADRGALEKTIFGAALDEIWRQTRAYFETRDPAQIARAEREPKHKMALVFRWYLGQSSRWANAGEPARVLDYQVWCGPAMGAFNEWTRGTFLEKPGERRVVPVALNLLYGAAVTLRAAQLRAQGVRCPPDLPRLVPLTLAELQARQAK